MTQHKITSGNTVSKLADKLREKGFVFVDEQEAKGFQEEDAAFFHSFSLRDQDPRQNESPEIPSVVATDNNEPHPGVRPSLSNIELQKHGEDLRNDIMNTLYGRGLGLANMQFNQYGQVYFVDLTKIN